MPLSKQLDLTFGKDFQDVFGLVLLASFALAIAHVANEIFCPHLLRVYPNFSLYHKAISEFVQQRSVIDAALAEMRDKRIAHGVANALDLSAEENKSLSDAISAELTLGQAVEPSIIDTYETDWREANISLPTLRYLVAFFYTISAILAGCLVFKASLALVRAQLAT